MNDIAVYPGYIDKVWAYTSGGSLITPTPAFGPASQYSYDVWVQFPSGEAKITKIKPVGERYPGYVNVVPLAKKRMVLVAVVKGQVQIYAHELLYVKNCGESQ